MKRLIYLSILVLNLTTTYSQNYHLDVGFTKVNDGRVVSNNKNGFELNFHKIITIPETNLRAHAGIGYNFQTNTQHCYERIEVNNFPRDVPIWPYNFNDENCELNYHSVDHKFNTQLGLSYRLLSQRKVNIEIQAINKISIYDITKTYFEDANLKATEGEL